MKVYNTSSGLNADFYPEAVGKLNNADTDPNALPGVSLAVDDLGYIKQGRTVSDSDGFTPTQAQLDAMNSGITAEDVEQITTNKNNILSNKADVYSNWTGGKNKLTYTLSVLQSMNTDGSWDNNACTKNGVTFTLNTDNTITVTGTIPASTNAIMSLQNYTGVSDDILTADEYGADHYIYLRGGNTTCNTVVYKAFANGDIGVSREVAIAIIGDANSSKTVNYMFKPMVCTESKYNESSTYYPYAMTNAEITAWIIAHS